MSVSRIAVIDGAKLRTSIRQYLQDPQLSAVRFISYRYQDFDLEKGRTTAGSHSLVDILSNHAEKGIPVTLVTRDPFSQSERMSNAESRQWHIGLQRMSKSGVDIKIHRNLHAKVYSFEKTNGMNYYAVGSSNLTAPGMGFLWTERNIAGSEFSDYTAVKRQILSIWNEKAADDYDIWLQQLRKKAPLMYLGMVRG